MTSLTCLARRTALALLVASLFAAAVGADVEVYRARYRTAGELRPIVSVAMSEGGSVAVDANSNSLVLIGSKAEIAQALALLELQDQRLRTVSIALESRTREALEAAGFEIRWSIGADGVRVGNVWPPPGGSGVAIEAREESGRRRDTGRGSVAVLEGSWGRISSGSSVLVPIGGARHRSTAVVTAASGMEVRPRILGSGQIRLDLRPFQGSLGQAGVVRHSGLETTLVVTPGQTAVVGGLSGSGDTTSERFLTGAARADAQAEQLLLVTATIAE